MTKMNQFQVRKFPVFIFSFIHISVQSVLDAGWSSEVREKKSKAKFFSFIFKISTTLMGIFIFHFFGLGCVWLNLTFVSVLQVHKHLQLSGWMSESFPVIFKLVVSKEAGFVITLLEIE